MVEPIKGSDQACNHCDKNKTCDVLHDHRGGDSIWTIQQTFDFGGCLSFRYHGLTAKEAFSREKKG